MKNLLRIILLLAVAYSASAQTFNIFDIDTTNFPIMKAKFYAFDAGGKQIRNLSVSDFEISVDNEPREVLSVSCPPEKPLVAISSVLTIDISGSMSGGGLVNAKAAATSWINALPLGKSECAITSFNSGNFFNQDFTTDRTKLLNAVNSLRIKGGTDFDAGFINKESGALIAAENGKYKKVVVFMTDGVASGNEAAIIQKANQINAVVYCVTLNNTCPPILRNVADQTGGAWFENVTTENQAEEIYLKILGMAQGSESCDIEWESEAGCSSMRQVEISCLRISKTSSSNYNLAICNIAKLVINPLSVKFGGVEPGTSKDITISIFAQNAGFSVSNIKSNNPNFDINPKSFSLSKGETKELTITFTPSDSGYNHCSFELESAPCQTSFYATGGFPFVLPKTKTLRLTHPNGGENFLIGSDTIITYEGIIPTDTVGLDYSVDKGKSWRNITVSATGLNFKWEDIPSPASDQCLIQVRQTGSIEVIDLNWISQGHIDNVSSVSWSPDGSKIASGSWDHTINILDAPSGKEIRTLSGHQYRVYSVSWSPDGSKIASGSSDNTIKIWDAATGNEIRTLSWQSAGPNEGHNAKVLSVSWSPDGSKIASGSYDKTIKVWDVANGKGIRTLSGHTNSVGSVSWSPDGSKIASGSGDQSIKIWDAANGTEIRTLSGHTRSVCSVSWSPDGTRIVSASSRTTFKIWDVASGTEIGTFSGHKDAVYSVSWSPDGTRIASGGKERTIKIWDVASGTEIRTLSGHKDAVLSLSWSPDCSRIVSGSTDNTVRVWNLVPFVHQKDESDALFSIVAPTVASQDIYMGQVITSTMKDSLITDFTTNTCSWPCRIDSIYFRGIDAPAFMLVGGIPKYTVEAGKNHIGEFRFTPTEAKYYEAEIVIITQANTLYQTISGDGVNPMIRAIPDILDFGIIEIREDSIISKKLIKNVSTQNITIDSTVMLGPDYEQFHIENGGGSFTLTPNEERELTISFAPKYIGRTSGQIGFYFDQAGSPAIAQLFGKGIGGNLRMLNDSAYAGDRVTLKIQMDNIDMNKFASVIGSYDITFSVDKTTLAPTESIFFESIRDDRTIINYSGTVENNQKYIAAIDFAVALGQYEISDIYIEEVIWYDHDGNLVEFDTEFTAGTFTLLGICREGGDRLIKPVPQAGIKSISPNPADNKLNIEFTVNESGYTEISIYNILGEKVKTLFAENVSEPGEESISADIKELGSGQYLLVFKTSTFLQSESLLILK